MKINWTILIVFLAVAGCAPRILYLDDLHKDLVEKYQVEIENGTIFAYFENKVRRRLGDLRFEENLYMDRETTISGKDSVTSMVSIINPEEIPFRVKLLINGKSTKKWHLSRKHEQINLPRLPLTTGSNIVTFQIGDDSGYVFETKKLIIRKEN